MGCYVNPKGMKNDKWVTANGKYICDISEYDDVPVYRGLCNNNRLPVVLVDNGSFYAAGVCFDEQEYNRFTLSSDPRPRTIYTVDKELLKTVVDVPQYIS